MALKNSAEQKSSDAQYTQKVRLWLAKLVVCVVLDMLDFAIGRRFGFGMVSNILLTIAGVSLFGWRGLLQLWEVADPTHQIDAFVPTLTLVALSVRPKR